MALDRSLLEMKDPETARASLSEAIRLNVAAPTDEDRTRVLRLEVLIPSLDVLNWLQAQRRSSKVYWRDRAQEFEAAGVGVADVIHYGAAPDIDDVFRRVRRGLGPADPNVRYYGGFAFAAPSGSDARWDSLGTCHFVLPRWELLRKQDEAILACNVLYGDADPDALREQLLSELQELVFPDTANAAAPLPKITCRSDAPDFAGWADIVGKALAAIDQGDLRKVVLARESCFAFDGPLEPIELLRRLQLDCTRSFGFYLQPEVGNAFLGASPERLYKRQSCYLQTEAIAGTRRRGASPEEDYSLGEQLLKSDKDLREHRFVVDSIQSALEACCRAVQTGREVTLLKLRRCQHLFRSLEGILNEDRGDADMLAALHPTPAVGGVPTQEALAWLSAHEPFTRWWYAGPVGWVSYDATEFIVAIRSGLVSGQHLCLYTGAGIVPGSVPEEEWDELENKMDNFLTVLTRS